MLIAMLIFHLPSWPADHSLRRVRFIMHGFINSLLSLAIQIFFCLVLALLWMSTSVRVYTGAPLREIAVSASLH